MKHEKIVRDTFMHPDNKGKSLREIARMLDMNPGVVYRILVHLKLIVPPPPKKQKKRAQLNRIEDPAYLHRKDPHRPKHPLLARYWDEFKLWEVRQASESHLSKNADGKIVYVAGIRVGWGIGLDTA
jgi:hypothetical protein